jgi:hypothetical protein
MGMQKMQLVSKSRSFILAIVCCAEKIFNKKNVKRKFFKNIVTLKFLGAQFFFSVPFIIQLNCIDCTCLVLPAVNINRHGVSY